MQELSLTEFDKLQQYSSGPPEWPLSHEVHLYCILFVSYLRLTRYLWGWLSADELKRANSLRVTSDRERFVLSHAFMRSVLAGYLRVHPGHVPLRIGAAGKPMINIEEIYKAGCLGFNIAHCATHAVIAVSRTALIGVDVEVRRLGIDALRIATSFLSGKEAETLIALPPQETDLHFLRLWTCKEAFVKAIGLGLSYPLDRFVVSGLERGEPELSSVESDYGPASQWSLRMWSPAPNCNVAVAVKIPRVVMRVRQFV